MTAMFLGFLPDREGLQPGSRIVGVSRNPDAECDRVCAHRKSADCVDAQTELGGGFFNQLPGNATNQSSAARIQSRQLGIDVEVTGRARSQNKFPLAHWLLHEERSQLLFGIVLVHVRQSGDAAGEKNRNKPARTFTSSC
jgi:hypothetical protein